jgi:hypothetical protein
MGDALGRPRGPGTAAARPGIADLGFHCDSGSERSGLPGPRLAAMGRLQRAQLGQHPLPAGGPVPRRATLPGVAQSASPPGRVQRDQVNLPGGTATGEVTLTRRAVVVLSASFDPGWSVSVDGRPTQAEIVAPALVAVTVPRGTHEIAFRYRGFSWYPELLALAVLDLLAVALVIRRGTQRTHRSTPHRRLTQCRPGEIPLFVVARVGRSGRVVGAGQVR